ncbi:PAP2-domain-containing protein [Sarocladium strictum]
MQHDAEITPSFPYSETEAVPLWLLGVFIAVIPFLSILIVTLIFVPGATVPRHTPASVIWRRKLWELHAGSLGLLASNIIAFFLTQGMKNLFGRPRPDLLDRCQPDIDNAADYVVGGFMGANGTGLLYSATICQQQDSHKLDDGFRSYPSGHSSSAAAGLVYLSLFLASKLAVGVPFAAPSSSDQPASHAAFPSHMVTADPLHGRFTDQRVPSPVTSKPVYGYQTPYDRQIVPAYTQAAAPPMHLLILVLAPFALSIYTSASRWFDFRHHGFDILFGYLIGLLSAIYTFRYYHLPISTGAGWAWGPRSHERAFWAGIGRLGYGSRSVDAGIFSTHGKQSTNISGRPGQFSMTDGADANSSEPGVQPIGSQTYSSKTFARGGASSQSGNENGRDEFVDVEMQQLSGRR